MKLRPLLFFLLFCLPVSLVAAPQKKELEANLRQIRYLVIEVDGTLTDGGLYYSSSGESLKRFNVLDNAGIEQLHKAGIEVVLLSLDDSAIAEAWAEARDIRQVMAGMHSKEEAIKDLIRRMIITPNRIAYLGSETSGLAAMKMVGVSACPSGAPDIVKAASGYVCHTPGGAGVVQEFAEVLLQAQGKREGAP